MDKKIFTTDEAKNVDINELFNKLSTDEKGLSSSEAEKRLEQYGPNEIKRKK